jgi:hypothetical protein
VVASERTRPARDFVPDFVPNSAWEAMHGRRYLSAESLALVLEDQGDEGKEVAELQAA